MARPPKLQRVDYFPHMCIHKKTMFIIEQQYGNDGYAFWFKLLEQLGSENGHMLDTKVVHTWEFMQARSRLSAERCRDILDRLAHLEAIDRDLWEQNGVIWSQNFVDNLADIYRKRNTPLPQRPVISGAETPAKGNFRRRNPRKPEFPAQKPEETGVSGAESAARIGQDRIGQERTGDALVSGAETQTETGHPEPPVLPLTADHSWQIFRSQMPLRNGKFLDEDACREKWAQSPAMWNQWLAALKNYCASREVAAGVVCSPMTFLSRKWKDFQTPEVPTGGGPGPPEIDNGLYEQQDQWRAECEEYDRKLAAGEIVEPPRKKPEWNAM